MKYVASVSWGKDSLAMLLMLIEKNYPLAETKRLTEQNRPTI